ncbi:hypothetical protein AGMMS49593_05650 [Endomicrobiia bacterium]|nr:hypothetical protein AGMMS49593_05650 [Endomicrobiia bacterium]
MDERKAPTDGHGAGSVDVSGASANERVAQKKSWLRQGKKLGSKGKYLQRRGKKLTE